VRDARPARDFRPLPLLGNPHVQTLLSQWLQGPPCDFATRPHPVRLPDGDHVVLHDSVPAGWRPGGRLAVLVHGLGGCHDSPHLRRMARLLLGQGVRAVRVDMRGAGHALALSRRGYHAGCSADLRAALAEVHSWSPASPLALVGISLGGNAVLKLAGEAAGQPVPGLACVATLGPPIAMDRCAALIAQPRNRLYELWFLGHLLRQARYRQRRFPDLPPLDFPRRMTLRLYDERYVAPRHGFASAADYYRQASAAPLVGRIPVPALMLTARDDPFIAVEPFESLQPPGHVEVHILPRGGHLGFLGRDGAGGIRWAEHRLVEWVLGR
jgi:predicted alpha/beta-fold hydrolase